MIIKGSTVGTTVPRANWDQEDPAKADYIRGKAAVNEAIAAARAAAGEAKTAAEEAKTAAGNHASDQENPHGITPGGIGAQVQHWNKVITLSAANWSGGSQSVVVAEIGKDDTIISTPSAESYELYTRHGLRLAAQSAGILTYTCEDVPREDLSIDITCFGAAGAAATGGGSGGGSGKDGISPVAKVTQTAYGAEISITDANGTTTATVMHGKDGKNGSSEITLPDYWAENLTAKIPAINTAMESAGRNKSAFFFYTDGHRISSSGLTPAILRHLYKHTGINKTNNGGDFSEPLFYPDYSSAEKLELIRAAMADLRGLPNHHSVIGNHDEDHDDLNTDEKLYGFYLAWEENNDIVWGGYHYYYIDNKSENTRYLYLDIGKNLGEGVVMISNDQMQFVIDALASVPEGWHVVPIAHLWYDYDEAVKAIPDYVQNILAVFDAYNGRTAGTVTHNGNAFAYDFAGAVGNVEFCMGGHVHADMVLESNGGIPIIITDTDSTARKANTATLGTVTEGCIDAVIADYNTRKVKLIRIGRGSDRTIDIPTYGKAEVVNILDVYDVQYNQRYSPTGAASGQPYKSANGIIAFSIPTADIWGKTIYFKGFSNITNSSTAQVSQWVFAEEESTTVRGFAGATEYNIFNATYLQENNGVYSIVVDKTTTGDHAFASASDRLQIQMVMTTGTAVSAADLANCVMTIDQPIE